MLKIYRSNPYFNCLFFESDSLYREIGAIKIHDGEKVLFSDRWFREIHSSNSNLEVNEAIIFDELNITLKRKIDLSLKGFAIMDLKEPQSVYGSEKEMTLYLHYDLFDFEVSYKEHFPGIKKIYRSKRFAKVIFTETIKDYQKPLSDYQFNTIYKTIESINESKYNLKNTEALSKKLIRQLKTYEALTKEMEAKKQADLIAYNIKK